MSLRTMLKAIRYTYRDITVNRFNRTRLHNHGFTIIANDCTGGVIYHDLKEQFNSPTINMFMSAQDYIKFISNMDAYLNQSMEEIEQNEYSYPLAHLGDIVLHLVHYESVEQAQGKWNERKQRINYDNIFYIMNDRNGCTDREAGQFVRLPLKHKLFFTAHEESGGVIM